MASRRPDREPTDGDGQLDPIEEAVAGYLDQLDAGETIDAGQVLAEHPTHGREILAGLEQFVELGGRLRAAGDLGAVGDYRLLRQVGRGGMGVVYEAWQNSMDRRVALKVLPAGVAADTRAVTRFMREARVAGRLQHRNIVSVFGTGVEAHTPYYAMEFVEGETLAQLLERLRAAREKQSEEEKRSILSSISLLFRPGSRKEQPLSDPPDPPDRSTTCGVENAPERDEEDGTETPRPPARRPPVRTSGVSFGTDEVNLQYCLNVAQAFARAAEGLQYAHDKGVIHRDLKPSNIILDGEGQLRILDFGLAHLEGQESLTKSGDFLGTPLYMSPEQALAKRIPLDHRTDIYSLGATLYEMLTWRPPFPGKDHQDTLSQIIFRDPTPLRRLNPRIPRDLETIVLKCLRKDPRDRFSTAEALAQDLHRFVRGDPVEARPQPAWERFTRRAWRQKGKIAVLGVLVLLILTSGLLLKYRFKKTQEDDQKFYNGKVLGAIVKLEVADQTKENPARTPATDSETDHPGHEGVLGPALVAEAEAGNWSHRVREAVDDLRRAAALFPQRPEAHYHLARGLRILGRTGEAEEELSRAIESDRGFVPARILREAMLGETGTAGGESPKGLMVAMEVQDPLAGTWLEAHRAAKEKRWKEAGDAYGKLLDLETPGREKYLGLFLEVRLGRGRSRLEAKDFDGALEDFAAVQALWPGLVEPALLLGKTYWRKGSRDRAIEIFEQLYRKSGPSIDAADDAAFKVAELLGDLKQHDLGLAWADRLKDAARREVQRSSFLRELDRLEEAIAAADEALEIDGRLARAWYLRGRARQKRGDLTGAMVDYSEALKIDPGHEEAYWWRASVRSWFKGRESEDLADLSRVIELNPAHSGAHSLRGYIRANRGDFEGAARDLGRVIDLDPKNFNALNRLTWIWNGRGEPDREIGALSQAIRANPGELNLCHRRNLLYQKEGDHRAAAAGAEDLLALAPEKTGGKSRFSAACGYSIAAALLKKDGLKDGQEADRVALERKYAGRAVDCLEKAFEGGFKDYLRLRGETDLEHLRGLPAFQDLIEKLSERNGAADPDLLAMVGEGRFSKKDFRGAVQVIEDALKLPNAAQSLARRLDEYRRAVLPDLTTYASIDWAVDSMEVLVPEGAEWQFFRGRSSPSPRLEWTRPDFDDSNWEKGPSGFGYGDGDDATDLADMRFKYSTVYLRRELTLPDPSRWRALTLSVVADDGFVAYLNGREVGRQRAGSPGTPLPSNFQFGGLAPDEPELLELPLDAADLLAGKNVIAIQGVNNKIDSTDFSLIPIVKGEPVQGEEREGELLAKFRAAVSGNDAPARISYLEGALLERAGKHRPLGGAGGGRHREAASKFAEARRLGGARPEPCLRQAQSLRATGDPAAAEALLREALEGQMEGVEALWDLWFEVSAVDLKRGAGEVLGSFPAPAPGGAARRSDLRWLLEELSGKGAIRINAGGEDYLSPHGVLWGRDRFFNGGYRYFGDAQSRSAEAYTGEIKNTGDDALYHTGRYFPGAGLRPPGYRIPLPTGRYLVTLHFAEIFNNTLAETLFEVKLEEITVLEGYEPLFVGFRTADARSVEVEVQDGFLDIELVHELTDPSISAIEVQNIEGFQGEVPGARPGTPLTPKELAERHYLRGFARLSVQDFGRAIASFNETLKIDPAHYLARWHHGFAQYGREEWGGAISDFTESLKLKPGDAWTYRTLGAARMAKGDLDGAIADETRALELEPRYVIAYCTRAEARLRKNDLDGAMADSEAAISIDPGCGWAHFNRGEALRMKNDLDGAIAAYTEAFRNNPDAGQSYNNRGVARWDKGDLDGAIADFTEALKAEPSPLVYRNRAFARLDQNDLDGAIADLSEALKIEPDHATMYERRASIRERKGDLDGALRDLARAIEIDPKRRDARRSRARIRKQQGDLDGAIAEYDAFAEAEPDYFLPLYERSLLLIEKGECGGAVQAVDAWLARHSGKISGNDLYNAACVYSRASARAAGEGPGDEAKENSQRYAARAVELLDQALEFGGPTFDVVARDPDLEPIRGFPTYRALFEKWSARTGGRDPEVLAILAEAQRRQGQPGEGVLSLEKALRLPNARQDLSGVLEERRRALLPDLASYASIDAALEAGEYLIPEGAEWRFFRGRSEPSAGQEWAGTDFDDSSWERGRGPFGYGDNRKDLTVLTDMRGNYTSLYLRGEFQVSDPARFRSLTLSLNADDGCVAYLNGEAVEWLRAGGPEMRVPFDGVSRGGNDFRLETRVRLPAASLRPGKNVIAVHGLNRGKYDGGFGLRAALWAEPLLAIDGERERFQGFRQAAQGDDAPLRLAYLEGRILQRAGSHREAAARFEEVVAQDRDRPEPWLRLGECLRASGGPPRAEARLRDALSRGGVEENEPLWDLWFAVSALDLKRSAAEIASSLPEEAPGGSGRGADLRWLLEGLSKSGAVRIRCGGDEYRSPAGKVWARDRFFRGGDTWTPAVNEKFDGSIGGTEDDPLYVCERWFGGNEVEPTGYRVPLTPGHYRLTLHFAEVNVNLGERRRFDLKIEGKLQLLSYEPAAAGIATADVQRFEVRVEDGFLDLVFIPLSHRPKISALEIEDLKKDGRKDEKEADREALERKYAGRAVELLEKAFDGGFKDYLRLRGETGLDPIRASAAFQDLGGKTVGAKPGQGPGPPGHGRRGQVPEEGLPERGADPRGCPAPPQRRPVPGEEAR